MLTGKHYIVVPSATTTERLALTAVNGMLVYDTTLNAFYKYENGAWSGFSGGGGAVDSVNGQTGVVMLDADDIAETETRFWLTNILKSAYDSAVTWISTNGTNLINHLSNTSNPHNTTAAQVGAPSGSGTSTGTNTGDNATNTTSNAYADAKVTDAIVDGVTTIAPSQNAVFDALALKQNSLGFTPENVANKQSALSTDVNHYYNAPYINSLTSANLFRIIDTNQYNVTGSTGETIAVSKLIPAGTFAVGDVLEVTYINRRINTAIGALTPRTSINTSNSLSGVSRMALGAVQSTGNTWQRMLRVYSIKSATETVMVNNNIQLSSDLLAAPAGSSTVNINWSVDQYLIFSHQNSNSADITAVEGITIRKL